MLGSEGHICFEDFTSTRAWSQFWTRRGALYSSLTSVVTLEGLCHARRLLTSPISLRSSGRSTRRPNLLTGSQCEV